MSEVSRRRLLGLSAAAIAATVGPAHAAAKPLSNFSRESQPGFAAVQINVVYRKSRQKEFEPLFRELAMLLPRRIPIALPDEKCSGFPRHLFVVEISGKLHLEERESWTLIHDEDGSYLVATNVEQMSAALKYLKTVARTGPYPKEKHEAYPWGVPPVVELPIGVTTSLPVHHVG